MSTLRIAPVVLLLAATSASAVANEEAVASPPPAVAVDETLFRYSLHPNENLTDVARIFRLPVDALIEANRIADPGRLRAGQVIEVPNAFALEARALRQERSQLAAQKQAAESDAAAKQASVTGLTDQITQLEAERDGLGNALAATAHWERAAKSLALALLAMVLWVAKLASDRTALTRRLHYLSAENGALAAAKQSYKDVVAQLELRFQQLYSGKKESTRDVVVDGVRRLKRAFADGTLEIERLIHGAKLERERDEQLLDATHRTFGWLTHPAREMVARNRLLVARDRLKEHASSLR